MTFTETVRSEVAEQVPGIVHTDGSTRPQWVDEHAHPAWRELISGFHEATGIPMVLNTSFNGRGRPIVATPADAIAEAQAIGLDAVFLEGLVVELGQGSR